MACRKVAERGMDILEMRFVMSVPKYGSQFWDLGIKEFLNPSIP
jgi:hypothetical protein